MNSFIVMAESGHESLHFFSDNKSQLRALIAVHSTRLGPALGGTRALSTYANEDEAVLDVLRLARAMTYKAALAGLKHGGGKAVIMLPKSNFDRGQLFEAYGRAVESLGGRYVTTEDSGTSPQDMAAIRSVTRRVTGMPDTSGDPSPVTAFGVLRGMEATAQHLFGSTDLRGRRVLVMGVGNVGLSLVAQLIERGAKVWVADADSARAAKAQGAGATVVAPAALLDVEADFYAPCALGGAINDSTLPRLKVKAITGGANNQLAEPRHGKALAEKGVLYVPDYAINAGGLINVAQEAAGYDREKARAKASAIYDTVLDVLKRAREAGRRPEEIADKMAEERYLA
ncbi:MAG: Leu/Phe/Val dehydrogenase [Myxococcaceae bacterium]